MKNLLLFLLLSTCIIHLQAQNENEKPGTVTIWEQDDPDKLNPLTAVSASARYMQNNIFCRLLAYGPNSMELEAEAAVARPIITEIQEGEYKGGMRLDYEIRKEAKWDNRTAITAQDYIFTVKAIKHKLVSAGHFRPYYAFIDKIEVDPKNPKKFTIYSKECYFLAEEASGDLHILPEYIYDEEQILRSYTIPQLDSLTGGETGADKQLKSFANEFNSHKFAREVVVGGGAYEFVEWEPGKHVLLKRKKKWWGSPRKSKKLNYPQYLEYLVERDYIKALELAKNGRVDVLRSVKPRLFVELKKDKAFCERYNLYSPDMFAYYYLGINCENPKLNDKRVRWALAHLVKKQDIIDILFQGMASPSNGPINPNKTYYNKDLKQIDFNLKKAAQLLKEAGWKDENQDGILDKEIDGETVDFTLKYKYNQGNEIRKNIGVLLQEAARKVGIRVDLEVREWTVFLSELQRHDFEIVCSAWAQGPGLDDMKQIWHTDSQGSDGSNRTGFGNAESDKIIEEIRTTLDPEKRKALYYQIQEIIQDEQPYIFLCVPGERIIIRKDIQNVQLSPLRPGYKESEFHLPKR